MIEKLELIKKRYFLLEKKILENYDNLKNISFLKEFNEIKKNVLVYDEYLALNKEYQKLEQIINENNSISKEEELVFLAQKEKKILEKKIILIKDKLKKLLSSEPKEDNRKVIMEIKGAAGGDESNLFVADLFRAYMKFAENKKWKTEIINLITSSKNGIFSVTVIFSGDNVYSLLKYESGVHRVQRVPITEKQGRIHTSTVKVLVIPYSSEEKFDLKWKDIRVDTFNASGPGGQSVNTTKSAVRLTHLPTGLSVASQTAKSQHQNKEKAFILLKNRIFYKKLSLKHQEQNDIKKRIIGRGERSEKIRTYNYSQNRITDHRVNLTLKKLDFFMEGKINLLIEPLIEQFNNNKN
ncbi:PCRF domain-containing protein [Texas Phoenix palm phytoplasma]|uniref:PCRF domain-containing protein n=1 Tax=Texas Phoenix palm phytoplasma TaxID=176709 RepID=A0ABS5BI28_9MOLU|nr:PCRF domain-containing protein [Texas Phoenix palm phytoplasma]MBP3059237.1 PCRF domain-containing protein [Texas Phoenix palm phytoplasma]